VCTRIERAFLQGGELLLVLAGENALAGLEHDRHAADDDAVADHDLLAAGVLDVDRNGGRVGDVPQAAVLGGDGHGHEVLLDRGLADVYVLVPGQ
jgi:hypothetical protein